jgi:hypothetical protein
MCKKYQAAALALRRNIPNFRSCRTFQPPQRDCKSIFNFSQPIYLQSMHHFEKPRGSLENHSFWKVTENQTNYWPPKFNMYFGVHCLDIKIHKVNGTNLTQWKPSQDLRNFDDYDSQTPWQWNLTSRWHLHKIMGRVLICETSIWHVHQETMVAVQTRFLIVAEDYGSYTIGNICIMYCN